MTIDGVNFNEKAIKGMSLKEFTAQCENVFWLDIEKSARRKRLSEVYAMINPPAKEVATE